MNEVIYLLAVIPIFIAILYALFHVITKHEKKHHLRHIVIIGGTAILAWVVANILKNTIAHPRPDLIKELFVPGDEYSFPSGHATFMFGLAFAMYGFDEYAGKILFVLAFITGVARVLAGVHYWYDILGGIVLGAGVSYIIVLFVRHLIKK